MRQTILIWSAALIAAASAIAQPKGQAKGAPRNPAQSPASQPGPKTATPQTYPIEQVQAGELRFTSQCGFCHGRDAAGGEDGPGLTRSQLVAGKGRGGKIRPPIRTRRT